eukprot:8437664-Alexandrium_andersonii.AAC.1
MQPNKLNGTSPGAHVRRQDARAWGCREDKGLRATSPPSLERWPGWSAGMLGNFSELSGAL